MKCVFGEAASPANFVSGESILSGQFCIRRDYGSCCQLQKNNDTGRKWGHSTTQYRIIGRGSSPNTESLGEDPLRIQNYRERILTTHKQSKHEGVDSNRELVGEGRYLCDMCDCSYSHSSHLSRH